MNFPKSSRSSANVGTQKSRFIKEDISEEMGVPKKQTFPNINIIPQKSTRVESTPEQRLTDYPGTYTELSLLPVRCYSCGRVMKQLAIEKGIKEGKTLKQVMDELNYEKICCRTRIISSQPIVKLQKKVAHKKNLDLSKLTIVNTGKKIMGDESFLPEVEFLTEESYTSSGNDLIVTDEVPPGYVDENKGFCLSESGNTEDVYSIYSKETDDDKLCCGSLRK